MDYYQLSTENNEFKIVLSKQKRVYSFTENSQYVCIIDFQNTIGQSLIKIEASELDYFRFLEGLNDFVTNFGNIVSDNLYFSPNSRGLTYFFYISLANIEPTYPAEDDDKIYLALYESSIQGTVLRINLETDIFWIEELIYALFQIIDDIPYLQRLSATTALEYIDYSQILRSPI